MLVLLSDHFIVVLEHAILLAFFRLLSFSLCFFYIVIPSVLPGPGIGIVLAFLFLELFLLNTGFRYLLKLCFVLFEFSFSS